MQVGTYPTRNFATKETIPKAGNIASYIQRNSQYPIYQNTDIVYFDEAVGKKVAASQFFYQKEEMGIEELVEKNYTLYQGYERAVSLLTEDIEMYA